MSDESGTEVFFGCVTAIVAVVVGCILNGLALELLWDWFVVSLFHLPYLSVAQAIGLALVIRVFHGVSTSEAKTNKTFGQSIVSLVVTSVGSPLMAIAFGWVVRIFL